MWAIKLQLRNTECGYQREGDGGWWMVKRAGYMAMEDDMTMGDGYTMQLRTVYHSEVHLKPI